MSSEHFAGRLRELREAAGITQAELATRVGVIRDAVAKWEAGNREPSWSNIIAVAAALGVTCEAFLQAPGAVESRGPGRPPKAAEKPAKPRKGK